MSAFHNPRRDDHAEADVIALSEELVDAELERADREAERADVPAFRAPTCRCGHVVGDHKSAGGGFVVRPRYGFCFIDGCGCTRFDEVREHADAA